jgi:hypothetical protein
MRSLRARWGTLKDYPRIAPGPWSTDDALGQVHYDQEGRVWQAEEVWRDGKWQRYYGFVARHKLARAPAAEVEFPPEKDLWAPLSRQLDCQVRHLGDVGQDWLSYVEPGKPVMVTLRLRNRGGLAQTVPSVLLRKETGHGLALHPGVDLHLAYAPPAVPTLGEAAPDRGEQLKWQELQARLAARRALAAPQKTLRPTEELPALRLDLHDWFDLTRPGHYRLWFTFHKGEGGFAEGKSNEVSFVLRPQPNTPARTLHN